MARLKTLSSHNTCHGESETRMQFTLSNFYAQPISGESRTVLQVSSDSDNIALTLLATGNNAFGKIGRLFVKIGHHYADILRLKELLELSDLQYLAVARLYCIARNDFNPGCCVASNIFLVKAYVRYSNWIGDLSSVESVQKLFYAAFLLNLGGERKKIPIDLLNDEMTLFSQDWRLLARKYVLFHAGTRNSSQIIPQDEDLHLVYLRACARNIEQYWKCADSMRE